MIEKMMKVIAALYENNGDELTVVEHYRAINEMLFEMFRFDALTHTQYTKLRKYNDQVFEEL